MNTLRRIFKLISLASTMLATSVSAQDQVSNDAISPTSTAAGNNGTVATSALETAVVEPAAENITPESTGQTAETVQEAEPATHDEESTFVEALSEEARSADMQPPPAPNPDPEPTTHTTQSSRIQSIVSDAFESPFSGGTQISPPEVTVDELPRQSHTQKLREAISKAAETMNNSGDPYVRSLRQEGDQTIVIDEETAQRPAVSSTASIVPDALPAKAAGPSDEGRTYRVRSGDSLWLIALRFYGNGHRYETLYEANKDRINNENFLHIGQELIIP